MRLTELHFLRTPLADRQQVPVFINRGCRIFDKIKRVSTLLYVLRLKLERGWIHTQSSFCTPMPYSKIKAKQKSYLFHHLFGFVLKTTPRVPNFWVCQNIRFQLRSEMLAAIKVNFEPCLCLTWCYSVSMYEQEHATGYRQTRVVWTTLKTQKTEKWIKHQSGNSSGPAIDSHMAPSPA